MWVLFWPGDVLAQWYVEVVCEAKTQHQWILPRYDCVFRWKQLTIRNNGVNIYIFVNQSNVNKTDLDLYWIGPKYFR